MTFEQSQPLNLDEISMHERPAPVITSVVMPGGEVVSPEEAALRDEQGSFFRSDATASSPVTAVSLTSYPPVAPSDFSLPVAMAFEDLGAEAGHLTLNGKGQFRDETIWFGYLPDELVDRIDEQPITIAQLLGQEVKELGKNFNDLLATVPYEKAVEVKRLVKDLNRDVCQCPGIVRRWTLQDGQGKVRPITLESVASLAPPIKEALARAIMDVASSGKKEHEFFLA